MFGRKKKDEVRTIIDGKEQGQSPLFPNLEPLPVEKKVDETPVILSMEQGFIYFLDSKGKVCKSKVV